MARFSGSLKIRLFRAATFCSDRQVVLLENYMVSFEYNNHNILLIFLK